MAQEDNDAKLIWFMAGAAIGAAAALLFAPQTGEQTRRLIGDKAKEGRDALADSGRDMMDRGRDLYERGRKMADEAAEMFDRGRKIVDRAAESVADKLPG
jgi:gas vesicle protein